MTLAEQYPTPDSLPPQQIRCAVAAHVQRAMWLLPVGVLLACVIAVWIVPLMLNLPLDPVGRLAGTAMFVGFFSLPALLFWACEYSIGVDARGIRKCPRFGRGCEMTWEDLAAGRISAGSDLFSYRWTDADGCECRLALAGLEEQVREWLQGLVRQVWIRPAAPPPPQQIECRMSGGLRFIEFRADCEGLSVREGKTASSHSWADVESVEIWYSEYGRHDFEELRLSVGARQFEWRHTTRDGKPCTNWNGSTAQEIDLFLQEHVSADRVSEFALTGTPRSLDEWERRRERIDRRHQALLSGTNSALLLICGVAAMLKLVKPGLEGLVCGAFSLGPLALIALVRRRDLEREWHRSQSEVLEWLKQLADQNPYGTDRSDELYSCDLKATDAARPRHGVH